MGQTVCVAQAKVNLALHVTGRRADGYHDLETIAVFADIGDRVRVRDGAGGLTLSGPYGAALQGETGRNLVLEAERLLREAAGEKLAPVGLHLEKNLPIASGIGGGSADAAAALLALARHWNLGLDLAEIASRLGADVPMCLASRPLLASGRGERLTLLTQATDLPAVLANPGVAVSTPAVFTALARRDNAPIGDMGGAMPPLARIAALRNDLEEPAKRLFPAIAETLELLRATPGCRLARMSGSGATCFALYDDGDAAAAARQAIVDRRPAWWCVAARLMAGPLPGRLGANGEQEP